LILLLEYSFCIFLLEYLLDIGEHDAF
jgi:hypothetical protein